MFHAGRHATDSSDYTSPLTAGGPTLAGEVRGYAVALTNAHNSTSDWTEWPYWVKGPNDRYNFSVGASTDEYDWNGYANCQAIHDYVTAHAGEGWEMRHFQAAWSCETYGNRTLDYDGNPTSAYEWQAPLRAPAGTSGWFLPSCAQLWYMQTHKDYLKDRFMAAKATADAGLQSYIGTFVVSYASSTEYGRQHVWKVNFAYKQKLTDVKNTSSRVRPVIVF